MAVAGVVRRQLQSAGRCQNSSARALAATRMARCPHWGNSVPLLVSGPPADVRPCLAQPFTGCSCDAFTGDVRSGLRSIADSRAQPKAKSSPTLWHGCQ